MTDGIRPIVIILALLPWLGCFTGCGDDVTQKCNELGLPGCDGDVAVNCEALCTMFSCDVEEARTTCGEGAHCEVRTIQRSDREPSERVEAICAAAPEVSCQPGHTACFSDDSWETCHAEAGVLVRTRCPSGQRCVETRLAGYFGCE